MSTHRKYVSMKLFFVLNLLSATLLYGQSQTGESLILKNEKFKVVLNKERPAVIEYHVLTNDWVTLTNPGSSNPEILFLQGALPVMRNRTVTTYSSSISGKNVTYNIKVAYENKPAIEFDLIYKLNETGLDITLRNIVEHKNFYLIHVQLPGLLSVKSDRNHANLIIPADAGRIIDIEKASLKSVEYEIDWLNPILTGFAHNSEVIGMIDTKSIENHTIVSVSESQGQRYGSFSMKLIHRLNEYNLHEFGTIMPVTDPKYLLKVQDSCTVTVTFTGDYDNDGVVSWVDGAKMFRKSVDAIANPYYKDKSFIRIFLSRRGNTNENLTFDEVLERIREFAAQTDSAAYVVYLLGWQYSGHDTGYPSVDKVNEDLGGYDKLVNLINEARKYNVNVSFYDNYDDSYPNNPGWDADVICRDPYGNIMRGGAWDGEQSYLISSYKYAVKSGIDRVRFTLNKYPIKEAYFIDVLAGGYKGGRKYDFNPKSPAGAVKNFEGKLMLLKEFNKQGIDVATEDFTGFFVGHVGTFGDICSFDNVYFLGEEQIPLVPFIYQGKTSFGLKTSGNSFFPRTFLYGQRAQKLTNKRSGFTVANYILDALPKQKLYGKVMKSYERYGDLERVVYEDGIVVEANIKTDRYSVTLGNGQVIAKDYTTFAPVKDNVYFAASRDGGLLSVMIPATWKESGKIKVFAVQKDGSLKNIDHKLKDSFLEFNTEPNAAYKVIY